MKRIICENERYTSGCENKIIHPPTLTLRPRLFVSRIGSRTFKYFVLKYRSCLLSWPGETPEYSLMHPSRNSLVSNNLPPSFRGGSAKSTARAKQAHYSVPFENDRCTTLRDFLTKLCNSITPNNTRRESKYANEYSAEL